MERRLQPNNNARQAKVTVWIFEGPSLFFLYGLGVMDQPALSGVD